MDGDMVLTPAEQVVLDAQIMAWPPGYTGDLEVMQDGVQLVLGTKTDHAMTYAEGFFVETHVRPVVKLGAPIGPLQIRVYDPSFYTAYDLQAPVTILGRDDCTVQILRADIDAAYALAEELLDGQDPNAQGPFDYFPEIGDAFADTIEITCAGPL
jgi:polyphosphate kinase